MSITVKLTPAEARKLLHPVRGQGGWQDFIRTLQNRLTKENELTLSESEIERVRRYVEDYGAGGWQNRLAGILNALRRSGNL